VVHPLRADPTGRRGPTPGAVRGPGWIRTSPGLFVPRGTDRSHVEQRIAEAAATLPEGGIVTGWSAMRLHGAAFFDGLGHDGRTRLPVTLCVPTGHHPRPLPGITHLRGPVEPWVPVLDLATAPATRALFDAMRLHRDVRDAVVDLDMAAAARVSSIHAMTQWLGTRCSWRGVPGVPVVRAALPLADEHSVSPQETRLRLMWLLDAGLPRPQVNQPVYDLDGRLLGLPDLLDEEAGLVAEYDGAEHRDAPRHSSDVDREALLRGHGLEVTRFTSRDLWDPGRVVHRLLTARRRALFEPVSRRRWTLTPPWARP
jgi:hypothetical protein